MKKRDATPFLPTHLPLGAILRDLEIAHYSKPTRYFSIPNDRVTSASLRLKDTCVLYGRHNVLYAADQPLAEVVEILPLIDPPESSS